MRTAQGRRRCRRARRLSGVLFLLTAAPAFAQMGEEPPRMVVPETTANNTGTSPMLTSAPSGFVNEPLHFGLGLTVGNLLTGASAKLWVARAAAFQAALGSGPQGNDVRAHLDLLFSASTWTSADGQYRLPAYLGIGGVIAHQFEAGQSIGFTEGGFRIPLGLAVVVHSNPIELFFEIAPEFVVRSNSFRGKYGFYVDGAIGTRYYF